MKYTQYFLHTRCRPDRIEIKDDWIEYVVNNPIKTYVQSDGRIRKWAKIDNKFLRVFIDSESGASGIIAEGLL